jgi:hypothetical protein
VAFVAAASARGGGAVGIGGGRHFLMWARALAPLLLLPALLAVDHGHFQYNSVSLGLALAAVALLLMRRELAAAAAFAAALNYKQMLLFFAPVFFVWLLGVACAEGVRGLLLRQSGETEADVAPLPPRARRTRAAAAAAAAAADALPAPAPAPAVTSPAGSRAATAGVTAGPSSHRAGSGHAERHTRAATGAPSASKPLEPAAASATPLPPAGTTSVAATSAQAAVSTDCQPPAAAAPSPAATRGDALTFTAKRATRAAPAPSTPAAAVCTGGSSAAGEKRS